MKKIYALLLTFALPSLQLLSQGTWTFAAPTDGAGTPGAESARAICVDASGNTYVVGNFNGVGNPTDFDLNSFSTNTFTASSVDGFIASYDKNGNFRWKTIVSGTGSDFNAPSGAVCTNGTFVWIAGTANVSLGAPTIMSSTNTVTITSPGTGVDAFVAKLNCSNGAVQWQQGFGGTGGNDFAMGICADPSGCVYVSGAYSSTFTLGSVTFPAFAGTISDVYIAKFTPSGVLRSVQTGGSTVQDNINAGSGLCYVPGATPAIVATGHTGAATAAFGAFTGLTNSGLFDAYLVELDTALAGFTNAMVFGSTAADELLSAAYDPFSGGVFVSGFCSGNITFPGTAALTGLGAQDIVIARYSVSANNFVWSSIAGGVANERGWCVAADGYGGILLSGHSAGACSFSGSVFIPANGGLNDLYVTRYNTAGTPIWVQTAISAGTEEARSIASYVETTPIFTSTIFVTGITNGAIVPFGSTNVGNDGGNDFFLAKINDASALPPLTATQSQVNLTCNGVCTGSATVVASGGSSPYTYSWAPSGGSGATASSLCAGTYTCTITDALSSSITKTFTITQPTAIVLNANTQTNVSCFGGSNGAASVVAATGGTPGYTYNWTPGNPTGDGTISVTGLIAGTWTCTVTDANFCTTTRTFNITAPSAIVVTPASQTNISCFGGSNGAASINTPTGGAGGYTYNWTPGNPTGDGTVSVTGLTVGTWTCTVTDANFCSATQTFNITQPTALVLNANTQTNISCFGGSNGSASVIAATGGAGGYTYNWTPGNPTGDGTISVTGLTAGTWTCTVTDANACQATRTFNITAPSAIVVTPASQTNISCFGGSNGASSINTPTGGAGGYTYNWTPGNPTGDGTVSVTGLTVGTWTCTVTDANSCVATQTFNITAPTAIVVTPASQTNISCFGGSNGAASMNTPTGGAGGYTYNWTPGNPTGDGTVSVTGLTAGSWTCTVTDANFCTATQTFNITQPTAIVVTPASQTNISCFGGTNGAASINTPTGGAGGFTYNWTPGNPTGDGTVSVTGLTAGTWTCTVTDANSCVATQTFNITAPTAIVVTPASQTNISCFGGSNGASSINTPTGGAGGFTYNWTPGNPTGDGTVSVTGLTAGTWTCTVTDANSCVATQTFNITAPTAIVVAPASQTNISCFGGSNGAASINTPTGGAGGFTYNWTPGNPTGDGTVSVTGLTVGTWTCTVTDANSCVATQTFNITAPTAIVVTPASQTNISCFGGSNGAASINTPTGGAGGFTYNWTPGNPTGDGTVSVTGLTAGSWTCTVTDANFCTATQTFNITQPTAITASIASTPTSCSANTGTATVSSVAGGTPGYTYNWTPSGGTATTATGLGVATYTCTITDANSCTITRTVNVTSAAAPTLTAASQTNISCNAGSNGAASVNAATGGTGPYTYNWTPGNPTGDGTVAVTGLTAGTWTCTVTDASGCNATVTFNVTQPTALVLNANTQTNISCFGGSNGAASVVAATGGAGGYTYNWTPGNPTGDGTVSVTGLTAGTWTCTVTDANSCTATRTFNITQPSAIVVTPASQTNISCFGGSNGAASINTPTGGAGGFTYNWTPGNPTGDGTVSVTGLTAGTWTCTVTDANLCTATQTFNITQPTAIVVTPASQTNISCNAGSNGAASINTPTGGAGGYTYNWTPGNPTGDGTTSVTGLTVGTWTCTVTDANSCGATQTFNITQPTAITASISSTPTSCSANTGTATVSSVAGGTPGYTYNWTPSGGTATTASGLAAATYTCTITDANSCTTTRTVNVTSASAPTLTAASQTNISCNAGSNGAASVNAATGGTGPYTYNWTPGNPTGDGTVAVTGLTAGTWTCTTTDAGGCTATATFNITQPTALVASVLSQTNISCNAGSNGAASVSVTGGTTAYSFNWTPGNPTGDGTASVTGLTVGTWTCTVTDANSCITTQTFNITQPAALVASALSQTNISCNAGSNGAASVSVTGGTTAYSYNWTPGNPTGDGTASVTGLTVGTWTCTVTDANLCTTTQTFNITQPTALVAAAASQTNISCNAGSNGAASVSVTGGTTVYSYNWTPGNPTGDGTASVTGLTVGTWTCTVTDANSCVTTQTFNITQPTALVATAASQTNILCTGNSTGAASVSVTGGTTAYSYNWTPGNPTGDGTASVTGLTAGTWTCTVTDANSCVTTQTFNITAPSALVASVASQTNVSCFGGSDGAASVSVTGGTTAYSYNWTPGNPTGDGTATVTGLTAGTWTCTVTDANSCTTTQTFNVTEPSLLVVSATASLPSVCSGSSSTLTASGATTYNWMPGNLSGSTVSVSPTATTTYTVTGTVGTCTNTATVTVTVNASPTITATATPSVICSGDNSTLTAMNNAAAPTYCQPTYSTGTTFGDYISSVVCNTLNSTSGASPSPYYTLFSTTSPTTTTLVAGNTYTMTLVCGTYAINDIAAFIDYNQNGTLNNAGEKLGETDDMGAAPASTSFVFTVPLTALNGTTRLRVREMDHPGTNDIDPCAVQSLYGETEDYIITITGGVDLLTYTWGPATFLSSTTGSPVTATAMSATTNYTVTATDVNGCTTTALATVTVNPLPAVTATASNGSICIGFSDTLTASGANTYAWSSGGTASTEPVTPTATSTYTVTGTDGNGCVNTATVSVAVNALPIVTASALAGTICNGANDTLIAAGASTYVWDNSATSDTIVVMPNTTTTYTVTGTDANGCVNTGTVSVNVNALPTVTASSLIGTVCAGNTDTLIAVGANTYVWDNAATTDTIVVNPTATTTYTVTGTDSNGCMNSATTTVNVNALPVVTLALSIDTLCSFDGTQILVGESPVGGVYSGPGVSGGFFDPATAMLGMNVITYTYTDSVTMCSASATDTIFVDICTDAQSPVSVLVSQVSIYPNPNNGTFTVLAETNSVLRIYDVTGNLIYNAKTTNVKTEINLSEFANGVYVLKAESGDNVNTQRIILNK